VGAVVVLLTALRHGATPARMTALREIAGVSRRTVERWRQWWLRDFVRSSFWKSACGRFASPLDLKSLPLSLLDVFAEQAEKEKTVALLRFILPLTTTGATRET
jgi:hypothetical protein